MPWFGRKKNRSWSYSTHEAWEMALAGLEERLEAHSMALMNTPASDEAESERLNKVISDLGKELNSLELEYEGFCSLYGLGESPDDE